MQAVRADGSTTDRSRPLAAVGRSPSTDARDSPGARRVARRLVRPRADREAAATTTSSARSGFLVREGPRFVSLAQEILPDGEGFRAVTHIPLPIVERMVRLERSIETTDPVTAPHLASG